MSDGFRPDLRRSFRIIIPTLLLLLLHLPPAWASPPTLEFFHPPGAAVGSTNTVQVPGKFEPWPPKVWVDSAGVSFLARTNAGEFQVNVAAGATPGVRLIRFFNEAGVSEPRPFAIGAGPEILEVEPNDHFAQAQRIERLPVTINGRLNKADDVDSFQVELKAGQTLDAAVDSIVLMSRLDAVLRVVTTNGVQLAWNHDFATLDPRLIWHTTNDQSVVVQVFGFPYPGSSDIRFTGSDGAIYRLKLALTNSAPVLTHGVDSTATPPPLVELPLTLENAIRVPGQLHRVRIHVKEPGWAAAEIHAESIGSPLDAWLRVDDQDGKQLSRNDDHNGSRDPYLEWQVTTNTDYTIVVGSLTRQAGEDHRFRFSLHRVEPAFTLTATASSMILKPGTTNQLKVVFARLRGFTNAVQLTARDLPAGISCEPVAAPTKDSEINLQFIAPTNAPPYQGPFQLNAHDQVSGQDQPVPFLLTGSSSDNGVPGGYRVLLADRTPWLWLTIPAPEPVKPAEQDGKK